MLLSHSISTPQHPSLAPVLILCLLSFSFSEPVLPHRRAGFDVPSLGLIPGSDGDGPSLAPGHLVRVVRLFSRKVANGARVGRGLPRSVLRLQRMCLLWILQPVGDVPLMDLDELQVIDLDYQSAHL